MGKVRAVAGWLPAVVLVPSVVVAGVAATVPEDELGAMREQQPLDLGTTWVYEVLDHGEPSGTRTSQVVRTVSAAGGESEGLLALTEVSRRYTDYPGFGPRSIRAYLAVDGRTMYQHAQEEADTWYDIAPPLIAYQLPGEEGQSWGYDGMVGDIEFSSTTELTEIVDVGVGGHTFEGCAHFVNTIPTDVEGDPDAVEVVEEWTCPDYGTVRIRDRVEATGVDFTEELVEFHGVAANWYAEGHEPQPLAEIDPAPGSTEGFDAGRTYAVPDGTLGRDLAWTDLRQEAGLFPPVSDGELMVLAERNGAVTLRTTDTGEMRWRVRLRGPILATPVIAGDAVIVADSLKQVWSLSLEDGRALWVRVMPDVVSAAPLAVGDLVAVPTDDGSVTGLRLLDGDTAWQRELAGIVRTALAFDGEHLLAGDQSGTLTSLDPDDGDKTWSASLDDGLYQGPLVTDGRVLVQDNTGIVHAFTPDGDIDWQTRGREVSETPMAAGNGVLLTLSFDQVSAFDTSSGDRLWRRELSSTGTTAPVVVGDEVLVGTSDGDVRVYRLSNGSLVDRWRLPLASPGEAWRWDVAPALVDDTLVLSAFGDGITNAALFAYPVTTDGRRGAHLRLSNREFLGTPAEPPVLAGDDVVVPLFQQLVKVAPDGATTVLMETPGVTQTGALVSDGIVVARSGETVQGRRLSDGELLWEAPSGSPEAGAVPATDGRTVFYGVADLGLVAVDLQSGRVRWGTPVVGQLSTTTPLVLPDGDVVYGGGGLARYDGATGEEEWRDPEAQLFGPATHAGGVVYAVGLSQAAGTAALSAYEARSGERLWSQPVLDPAPFLGPAVGQGVVVAFDGDVARAHDARTGDELWSLTMSRAPIGLPVVADGRVYLAEGGNGRDVLDDSYRISVHDVRTGRFLTSWQPAGTPLTSRPIVAGTPDGRLLVPDLGLTVLEVVE